MVISCFPSENMVSWLYSEESLSRLQMVKGGRGRKNGTLIYKRKQWLRFSSIYLTQKRYTIALYAHALLYKRRKK